MSECLAISKHRYRGMPGGRGDYDECLSFREHVAGVSWDVLAPVPIELRLDVSDPVPIPYDLRLNVSAPMIISYVLSSEGLRV